MALPVRVVSDCEDRVDDPHFVDLMTALARSMITRWLTASPPNRPISPIKIFIPPPVVLAAVLFAAVFEIRSRSCSRFRRPTSLAYREIESLALLPD